MKKVIRIANTTQDAVLELTTEACVIANKENNDFIFKRLQVNRYMNLCDKQNLSHTGAYDLIQMLYLLRARDL